MTDSSGAFLLILMFVLATILISKGVAKPHPQYLQSKVVKTFSIDPDTEIERQQETEE